MSTKFSIKYLSVMKINQDCKKKKKNVKKGMCQNKLLSK